MDEPKVTSTAPDPEDTKGKGGNAPKKDPALLAAEKEIKRLQQQLAVAASKPTVDLESAPSDPKQRVTIKLFKDNGKYKEPLFVQVNEYRALIERGVEVSVPYYVALHIKEMEEQDSNTATMIAMKVAESEDKFNKLK